jgi:hypothetical protein
LSGLAARGGGGINKGHRKRGGSRLASDDLEMGELLSGCKEKSSLSPHQKRASRRFRGDWPYPPLERGALASYGRGLQQS